MFSVSKWIRPLMGLLILCLLSGCSHRQAAATKEFEAYCQNTFSFRPQNDYIYCILPSNQCRNCILYNGNLLPEKLRKQVVLISCFPSSDYKNFHEVYYDREQRMMGLEFLDYTSQLVLYNNNHVEALIPIHDFYKQLDSLALSTEP